MNSLRFFIVFATFVVSSSTFAANDCRAIFDPGYSKEAQALVGNKFKLVDEEKIADPRVIPFRIVVKDDVDVDPETLTFQVLFNGIVISEEKRDAGGFQENVDRTVAWIKKLPSCEELYRPRASR
jgi:hypothetical protein